MSQKLSCTIRSSRLENTLKTRFFYFYENTFKYVSKYVAIKLKIYFCYCLNV